MPLPAPRFIVVENNNSAAECQKDDGVKTEMDFMEVDNEASSGVQTMLCRTETETQGGQGVQQTMQMIKQPSPTSTTICQKRLFRNRSNELGDEINQNVDNNFHQEY